MKYYLINKLNQMIPGNIINYVDDNKNVNNNNNINHTNVHLRIQQRTPRTSITIIEGLDQMNLNLEKISKYMKKIFSCGANIAKTEYGKIIQLQGDQRINVKKFLVAENILEERRIIVHGY